MVPLRVLVTVKGSSSPAFLPLGQRVKIETCEGGVVVMVKEVRRDALVLLGVAFLAVIFGFSVLQKEAQMIVEGSFGLDCSELWLDNWMGCEFKDIQRPGDAPGGCFGICLVCCGFCMGVTGLVSLRRGMVGKDRVIFKRSVGVVIGCPHCSTEVDLGGYGRFRCPHCGDEFDWSAPNEN